LNGIDHVDEGDIDKQEEDEMFNEINAEQVLQFVEE